MKREPYMSRTSYQIVRRVVRFLILIMGTAPVMVHSESVFIDRPGKEFSSTRSSQGRPDPAQQAGSDSLWFQKQDKRVSQSRYPDSNRRSTARQDNPWRSDGRVYTDPQHKLRPWGGVPADAPQEQREYGKADAVVPRYQQPYYYRYQPAPMTPYSVPGYGGYSNAWSSPYGAGYMPGYGGYGNARSSPYGAGHMPGYGYGGNQYSPFGSFGGMPGPGNPGGMFW